MAFQINLQHPQLRRYKLWIVGTFRCILQITQIEFIWLMHRCYQFTKFYLSLEVPVFFGWIQTFCLKIERGWCSSLIWGCTYCIRFSSYQSSGFVVDKCWVVVSDQVVDVQCGVVSFVDFWHWAHWLALCSHYST